MAEQEQIVAVVWANDFTPNLLSNLLHCQHFRLESFSDPAAALAYFERAGNEVRALVLPDSVTIETRIDFLLAFQARAPRLFERVAVMVLEGLGPQANVVPLKTAGAISRLPFFSADVQ